MYLTRFQINTARRGSRKLLASPQAMHAAVRASFAQPSGYATGEARTLWRLDDNRRGQVTLYIASPGEPDLTHLVEQAGWPATERWDTRAYGTFLDRLEVGQRWAFRLTANPTHTGRRTDESPTTQRFGQVTVAQQVDWLTKRAKNAGFVIAEQADGTPNLVVGERITRAFHRKPDDPRVTLVTARYQGMLEVCDALTLRLTLRNGIGHAKAYGCGLITLSNVMADA